MVLRPKTVFKYKSLDTEMDLTRLLDIIQNHRVFVPNPSILNDPMEANAVKIHLYVAGAGYVDSCGQVSSHITSEQEKYRILSFASVADSPVMWAHYAKEYSGCCLIFSTEKTFKSILPVVYTDNTFDFGEDELPDGKFDGLILDSFLFKMRDWSYENEWRFIEKKEAGFVEFKKSELLGLILGEKVNPEIKKCLSEYCAENGIMCLKTHTMPAWSMISFVPVDVKEEYLTANEINNLIEQKAQSGEYSDRDVRTIRELNDKMLRYIY